MTSTQGSKNEIDIGIRASIIEDAEAILEIEKTVFSSKLQYGYSIILGLISTSLPHLTLTAYLKKSKKIIGFISGEVDDKDNGLGRLITIEIDTKLQSYHIGSKLLLKFEDNIVHHYSVQEIDLQVHSLNKAAISFYEKHNYQKIKELRNYYARREHAFLMKKRF
ncbi:MAG: GNAT family N-acetyltransferase [Candidatus Heimdallarchaeota archaeon]|nr:GNAT family N-acetyltransferase [Candidatus Heimdallarchaeota archaeon]